MTVQASEQVDEHVVRIYLRQLISAPVRGSGAREAVEGAFVDAVGRWATRTGVDRKTLLAAGVPGQVLDSAGLRQAPVEDIIRPHFSRKPFDASTVAGRACVSISAVRSAVKSEELAGTIERVPSSDRTIRWRLR